MTEVRPIYYSHEWQSGRLIDVVNHLPADVVLTASPLLQEHVGHSLDGVGILQACNAVIEAKIQDYDASIQDNMIILHEQLSSSPIFMVHYPVDDDERERARLASQWLMAALNKLPYSVEPINWKQDGLKAQVVVSGLSVGTLLDVYNHFRTEDNFNAWLRSVLGRETVTTHLRLDVDYFVKEAPLVSEQLAKLLLDLDNPILWLKISNVRLLIQYLKGHLERTDGLLELLDKKEGLACTHEKIDPNCEECVERALEQLQRYHRIRGSSSDVNVSAFQEFLKWIVR